VLIGVFQTQPASRSNAAFGYRKLGNKKLSNKKRASWRGALFVCLLFPFVQAAALDQPAAQTCRAERLDETAVAVEKVVDGDTLHLQDGRSVRLIGINSPEVGYADKAAEPMADAARDALKDMLGPKAKVGLRYGREEHDRYQRLLAHVYLANGESVQARMLAAGLAAQIVVPPNLGQFDCYRAAEQTARKTSKGVWSGIYRPLPIAELSPAARGFKILTGRIERVGQSKNSFWLNFPKRPGEGRREGVAVRIAKKDLGAFVGWRSPMKIDALQGKTIVVRGWIYQHKKQQVIRVRHPASIDVLQ
jgi:endonuclease YncB( thermonuclease family)